MRPGERLGGPSRAGTGTRVPRLPRAAGRWTGICCQQGGLQGPLGTRGWPCCVTLGQCCPGPAAVCCGNALAAAWRPPDNCRRLTPGPGGSSAPALTACETHLDSDHCSPLLTSPGALSPPPPPRHSLQPMVLWKCNPISFLCLKPSSPSARGLSPRPLALACEGLCGQPWPCLSPASRPHSPGPPSRGRTSARSLRPAL